jgi:AcrR family transcriptional regulator
VEITAQRPAVEGAWDRRRRLVSLDIEFIALGVFAEHGFDATTVDEVAKAAGISESTFFRYFASKDDVLFAAPRRVGQRMCEGVLQRPPGEPLLAAWRAVISDDSLITADDLRSVALLKQIVQRSPSALPRIVADHVATQLHVDTIAARLGADPSDVRPAIIAAAIYGALGAANTAWHSNPHGRDPAPMLLEALDVLADLGHL